MLFNGYTFDNDFLDSHNVLTARQACTIMLETTTQHVLEVGKHCGEKVLVDSYVEFISLKP